MLRVAVSCSGALRVIHLLRLTAREQMGTHAPALLQLHHWVYRAILYLVDLLRGSRTAEWCCDCWKWYSLGRLEKFLPAQIVLWASDRGSCYAVSLSCVEVMRSGPGWKQWSYSPLRPGLHSESLCAQAAVVLQGPFPGAVGGKQQS